MMRLWCSLVIAVLMLAACGEARLKQELPTVESAFDLDAALRSRFRAPMAEFTVILVGKDGGEKLRSGEPVTTGELFALIDTMPMRQQEMRRQ